MRASADVIRVGTTWEDLDRREHGRTVYVLALDDTHATCRSTGRNGDRNVRIRLDRFGKAFKLRTD